MLAEVENRLKLVLAENSAAKREQPIVVQDLEELIKNSSREQVVEKVAYIWFNRFCALRFMDANHYTDIGVVSPAEGQSQPEILAEAKAGHIDELMLGEDERNHIFALLNGSVPSSNPQEEAYRLLLVAACNAWYEAMPFLFERIADYTELLMPDNLLAKNSILESVRDAMTPEDCGAVDSWKLEVGSGKLEVGSEEQNTLTINNTGGVEIIGWLYQFYISEKKDEVFDGLKKNKKITPENIPAATQLFTPHWIVRYLVENSLGRLWMLNRPGSKLVEQMDYYIKPEQPETDYLQIKSPEEIKICDPACGSGHMLTYAFDLLYSIYEEEGYLASEIPQKILTHNLYGIELDERAGELAAFALTMKARARQRRFFRVKNEDGSPVKPNICVLQNIVFSEIDEKSDLFEQTSAHENELKNYIDYIGREFFTDPLIKTLYQFEEADNFGSLIQPEMADVSAILKTLELKKVSGELLIQATHKKVIRALHQIDYLSSKYHVVIANPPYMGGKGMNARLKAFLEKTYPLGKSDLMTCFMEQANSLIMAGGFWGMINLPSWMFLQSFFGLRSWLLDSTRFVSLLHLGRGIFGADFGSVAFVIYKPVNSSVFELGASVGVYRRLFDKSSIVRNPNEIEKLFRDPSIGYYKITQKCFMSIPGKPISYWAPKHVYDTFKHSKIGTQLTVCAGLTTGNTERFLRYWHEVETTKVTTHSQSLPKRSTFIPYDKGGSFRKWYGNLEYVLWFCANSLEEMKTQKGHRPDGLNYFFRPSITWSKITISLFSARFSSSQNGFDATSSSAFGNEVDLQRALQLLNSKVGNYLLNLLNSTMVYLPRDIKHFPAISSLWDSNINFSKRFVSLVNISKTDWNSYENSLGFMILPILNPATVKSTLKTSYKELRAQWKEVTQELQWLEEENNRIFIEAYGLQDELTPDVPLNEITLTCNPHYRYGGNKSEEELEALLLADTMREFISYAVGCMFGRYSLDKPGLILANQGETLADYVRKVESWKLEVERKEGQDGCAELSGVDCLAEGNGSSGDGLSSFETVSPRGALCVDKSGEESCGIGAVEHCGRTGAEFPCGVSELSVDSAGITSRSGNSDSDCTTAPVHPTESGGSDSCNCTGNQTNDSFTDGETALASNSPLSTSNSISFMPDDDNVIPILEGDWFSDDIAERFRKFLRVTFGDEHYEENLRFIEKAIGKDIQKFFVKDFYKDHIKRYKKRPIYWMFSSPKGSFNALIYMHRYRPDTVSVVLNDYLREFRMKLNSRLDDLQRISINPDASKSDKTKALKEIEKIKKMVIELDDYERDVLFPLAANKIEIDLDDGVKVNYPKFGSALKHIPGLSVKEK